MLSRVRRIGRLPALLSGLLLGLVCMLMPLLAGAAGNATDAVSAAVSTDVQAFDEGLPAAGSARSRLKPYGANLFEGGYQTRQVNALDPDYQVRAGDRIALRLGGATTLNEVMTVDTNGNIFVPDVGEIRMLGVRSADVSNRIKVEAGSAQYLPNGHDTEIHIRGRDLRQGRPMFAVGPY